MPISAIYNVRGGTIAQYDQVIEALGEHANSPGGLAHIAAATPDGFLVCDVWESQGAFDSFAANLLPCIEAAGIAGQAALLMGRVENMFVAENANDMPTVAILYSFPGMSAARYREVLSRLKHEWIAPVARRAHIAMQTAEGMVVIAVWESEPAFRAFEPAVRAAFAVSGVDDASPVIGQIHRIGFTPGVVQGAYA